VSRRIIRWCWCTTSRRAGSNLTLLGELRRRAPEVIDWAGPTAAGVVQMLDAFEAAQEALARCH
jgi:hypothetical protein